MTGNTEPANRIEHETMRPALFLLHIMLLIGVKSLGQCNAPNAHELYEPACGIGLLQGQSFSIIEDGELLSLKLNTCQGLNASVEIRKAASSGEAWNSGTLLGTSVETYAAVDNEEECLLSSYGYSSYVERTFNFETVFLQSSESYVFILPDGAATSTCNASYAGGEAYSNGNSIAEDIAFDLIWCPAPALNFGCTDALACNYDANATASDGACTYSDCAGICGGTAYDLDGCGCVGGSTGVDPSSCFGCTDSQACNYAPDATLDDDSCLYLDCNGECGGTAVFSDCEVCLGGSTGLDEDGCINGCLTDVIRNSGPACSIALLKGQSFIATQTGFLTQVNLDVCCGSPSQLTIREFNHQHQCDETESWNAGTILGTSQWIDAACPPAGNCLLSIGGEEAYQTSAFTFTSIPVIQGHSYVLELNSGYAVASCEVYDDGQAYDHQSSSIDSDLIFAVHICSEGVIPGCTDPTSCAMFDPNANIDDGSCQYEDCNGECGGEAIQTPGCGCIGGSTGIHLGRCLDGIILDQEANLGAVCSPAMVGQTLTIVADGLLQRLALNLNVLEQHTIQLIRHDGPLSGQLEAEFTWSGVATNCVTSSSEWTIFEGNGLALEGGRQYRIVFEQGGGMATCDALYAGGAGLGPPPQDLQRDMAFGLFFTETTPGQLTWGCTDQSACNYDALATHDNGTCSIFDCHGDCGGNAYFIDGCGCVGGETGVPPNSCHGCTEPSACNYAPDATIDDGSCAEFDCHGTCGGSALLTPQCGCTGGETGLSAADCSNWCQGEPVVEALGPEMDYVQLLQSGTAQTFTPEEGGYLTSVRVGQYLEPTSGMITELRLLNGTQPNNGTLLSTTTNASWESMSTGGIVELTWDTPATITAGETYSLIFIGPQVSLMLAPDNRHSGGLAYESGSMTHLAQDLHFEILVCDELNGCTIDIACNYNPVATVEDGSCVYPSEGTQCNGSPCSADGDGDGVCDVNDLDPNSPFVCMDSDGDSCDDCSSGTFDPDADGPDSDGDGLCDSGDNCSDAQAENFADPSNGFCRGECDSAPILLSAQLIARASGRYTADGIIALDFTTSSMLFTPPSQYEVATVTLQHVSNGQDVIYSGSQAILDDVPPGLYRVHAEDIAGCPAVSNAPNGSTFGQPPVEVYLNVAYTQCCGSCGQFDVDSDGICDQYDQCTDRAASNFDDMANSPCQY